LENAGAFIFGNAHIGDIGGFPAFERGLSKNHNFIFSYKFIYFQNFCHLK